MNVKLSKSLGFCSMKACTTIIYNTAQNKEYGYLVIFILPLFKQVLEWRCVCVHKFHLSAYPSLCHLSL